jgi:hypothetical protein
VIYAALVGSSTRPDPAITPRELRLLVRFDPERARRIEYRHMLQTALEILTDVAVDLIDIDAARDKDRMEGLERTMVVLYDAGPPDAGAPDAGAPDAGPPDAGAPDA